MGMVPNGLLPNASAGLTRRLDPERWAAAEDRTAELIARIQPNALSEGRRQAVFHYVQRLIMNCLPCQVFTFGSVPLKTYLPDGDIDVTAFSYCEELREIWANLVQDALEREEKSESAEFHVKEVQYIQAEVKIIKCLVENIAVDISFNQVGGLCTLCFLEQIDNLIKRNHLFKRSIILIKAWCFYESRILGAHHGLISTYALETLVLYIFHTFNNSFTGPLEVLFHFLEFFSNFDWEKCCLSLSGPVPVSSLPDMTAETPWMDSGELLLSKSFLDSCNSTYGVMPRSQESQGQQFVLKHFNVIDPLRTNNNLGRSVSKGNFFRIRSAFAFGAKRLGKILECPKEDLIAELNKFFINTWIRYGRCSRPDVPTPLVNVPDSASGGRAIRTYNVDGKEHYPLPNGVLGDPLGWQTECIVEDKGVGDDNVDGNEHSPLPNGVPGDPLGRQTGCIVEDKGVGDDNYSSTFQSQAHKEVSIPSSHASSSRGKALDASAWDEMDVNASRSSSNKWGKGPTFAAPAPTTLSKFGWQMENTTEHLSTEVDVGPINGALVPRNNEASELVTGSDSFSAQSRANQGPYDFNPLEIGIPNPIAPSLIGFPQQRKTDSFGLTFGPTGPPVPFVVLPFVPGSNNGSITQFDRSEGTDQPPASITGQNTSLLNGSHQPDSNATSTPSYCIMPESSDEHKPDILNSDFVSHWHNLQYARLCQNARSMGPVLYPFAVPPVYLQGHAPWDGPARPAAPNVNWAQMVGPGQRVFHVMPVQPATERPRGVLQHYGEDAPRYRGGTGTYLPNPVPFRDRHSSSRNNRGSYNNGRSDHVDKEGSWINSKQRNPNRTYGRNQSERSGMRSDRQATDGNQSDRKQPTCRNDSYRLEAGDQFLVQGQSFESTNSMSKPGNVAQGVCSPPPTASNVAGALSGPPGSPLFMVCSHESGLSHGSASSEPVEFGSLGPLPTAGGDEIPRPTRQVIPNGFCGQGRGPCRGGSSHSSPDRPP